MEHPVSSNTVTQLAFGINLQVKQSVNGIDIAYVALWLLHFGLVGVSLILNGCVVIVYARNRLLHTVNNGLVANLASSDLLYTVVVGIEYVKRLTTSETGGALLFGFALHTFYYVSVYTCVVISFCRFMSVACPHRSMLGHKFSGLTVTGLIWLLGIALLLPSAVFVIHSGHSADWTVHDEYFANDLKDSHPSKECRSEIYFKLYTLAVDFAIPLVALLALYAGVYTTVMMHKLSVTLPDVANAYIVARKSKRLMLAIVGVFLLTSGTHSVAVVFANGRLFCNVRAIGDIVRITQFTRTIANPIIYAICNPTYAQYMAKVLRCNSTVSPDDCPLKEVSNASLHTPRWCNAKHVNIQKDVLSTAGALPTVSARCTCSVACSNLSSIRTLRDTTDGLAQIPHFVYQRQAEWCRVSVENMSVRSSIPTVLRLSERESRRHELSHKSSLNSQYVFGVPTPAMDSGRSSFDLWCGQQKQEVTDTELVTNQYCNEQNIAAETSTFSKTFNHCTTFVRTNR